MGATNKPGSHKGKTWPQSGDCLLVGTSGRGGRRGALEEDDKKRSWVGRGSEQKEPRERKRFNQDHRIVGGISLPTGMQTCWEAGNLSSGSNAASSLLSDLESATPFSGPNSSSKKVRQFDTKRQTLYDATYTRT